MILSPALRHIMNDRWSLCEYSQGGAPKFEDVKRRLLLSEREGDKALPDHLHRLRRDLKLEGATPSKAITSLRDLVTIGLVVLAEDHLADDNGIVRVLSPAFTRWQDVLTLATPLPLVSAMLSRHLLPNIRDPQELGAFLGKYIIPNLVNTALPSPSFPYMEQILEKEGFADLHIHLNGSVETDIAWQTYLEAPYEVYKDLNEAFEGKEAQKVIEQYEQEAPGFDPRDFYNLLRVARILRARFVYRLFGERFRLWGGIDFADENYSADAFRRIDGQIAKRCTGERKHPMAKVFRVNATERVEWPGHCLEALMHAMVIRRLEVDNDREFVKDYHFYLLILGLFNRFLVQQTSQTGFDQFQKITLNSMRELPEKTFEQRFAQLSGNKMLNYSYLEGRFSPKASAVKNIAFVNQILNGWYAFRRKARDRNWTSPELKLVCHFIKSADKEWLKSKKRLIERNKNNKPPLPNLKIRHSELRLETWLKARELRFARAAVPSLNDLVTGIDAASNELEAQPEVFAPSFRLLRKSGVRFFTYHAGEDFYHIIGGMRAIWEAIDFLDMGGGDRIGHGTAIGLDPARWLDKNQPTMLLRRGEWLDDLVFAMTLITEYPECGLGGKLARLTVEIEKLGIDTYGKFYPYTILLKAWRLRKLCPFHLFRSLGEASRSPAWSLEEWKKCVAAKDDEQTLELASKYHNDKYRFKYDGVIEVPLDEIFAVEDLKAMQNAMLKLLHEKEIVIESLPTSNVRISYYNDVKEHHIWRWLGVADNEKYRPSVVLGTDDTGIFATNIYNEYNHLYNQLMSLHGLSPNEASGKVRELMQNASAYAFSRPR